jgi:hypothetical protein
MQPHEMKDGYDYICSHVDDFKIVAKEPERWRDQISSLFLLKSIGPRPIIWVMIITGLRMKRLGC